LIARTTAAATRGPTAAKTETVLADDRGEARTWCSLVAKEQGEDPVGSVSPYDLELAVEVPLPWARAVAVSATYPEALRDLPRLADAHGLRLRVLAIAPDAELSQPGRTRVFALRRLPFPAAGFVKAEYLVPAGELGGLAAALVGGPDAADRYAPFRRETAGVRDLLVCTHGTRDACCATFGAPLYERLRSLRRFAPEGGFRVWRTSHLGGHRFAPTLLDLADGRTWGHLDAEAATGLLQREGEPPDLDRHYRGWDALDAPQTMAAEREVFKREGWAWTGFAVRAETTMVGDRRAEVRLAFTGPDGRQGVYEATVEPSGVVVTSLGSCGDAEPRRSEGYRVARLELRASSGTVVPVPSPVVR
jgi:hypothetical protein